MEKLKDVYKKVISKENLYRSAHAAARGRRYTDSVSDFNFRLEEELDILHGELARKTYVHGRYRVFSIYEPKERRIAAAPFRDRVAHHALHDIIEPMIDGTFIYDSYACRKGKGTHKAVDRAQSFLRANRYCFHGDIKKYFPSIDHDVLKGLLRVRIGDEDALWLAEGIIDSARQLTDGPRGLPMGNLTSQFFANLYLNEIDYFVKFNLRRRHYIRYMDDFLVFGDGKEELKEVKSNIRDFLRNRLNLSLHEGKSQVYRTGSGITFLGFRLYRNHRRLATANVRRFRRRLKKFAYLLNNNSRHCERSEAISKIRASVRSWLAHASYADTNGLVRRFSGWLANRIEAS